MVISACVKGGEWAPALSTLGKMEQEGFKCDTATHHAVMLACESAGECEQTLRLFEDMERKGLERDAASYSTAIAAGEKCRQERTCDDLYSRAYAEGRFDHCHPTTPGLVHLHSMPPPVARCAVRLVLADARRAAAADPGAGAGPSPAELRDLVFLTGTCLPSPLLLDHSCRANPLDHFDHVI